jgi:hypothetical protein
LTNLLLELLPSDGSLAAPFHDQSPEFYAGPELQLLGVEPLDTDDQGHRFPIAGNHHPFALGIVDAGEDPVITDPQLPEGSHVFPRRNQANKQLSVTRLITRILAQLYVDSVEDPGALIPGGRGMSGPKGTGKRAAQS